MKAPIFGDSSVDEQRDVAVLEEWTHLLDDLLETREPRDDNRQQQERQKSASQSDLYICSNFLDESQGGAADPPIERLNIPPNRRPHQPDTVKDAAQSPDPQEEEEGATPQEAIDNTSPQEQAADDDTDQEEAFQNETAATHSKNAEPQDENATTQSENAKRQDGNTKAQSENAGPQDENAEVQDTEQTITQEGATADQESFHQDGQDGNAVADQEQSHEDVDADQKTGIAELQTVDHDGEKEQSAGPKVGFHPIDASFEPITFGREAPCTEKEVGVETPIDPLLGAVPLSEQHVPSRESGCLSPAVEQEPGLTVVDNTMPMNPRVYHPRAVTALDLRPIVNEDNREPDPQAEPAIRTF
jgi:hypothetical protein